MRKLIPVVVIAAVAVAGAAFAPQARADYADVKALTPFSPAANYMSLPGYLRYRYLLSDSRWITRDEADEAVRQQGAPTGAPTG